MRRHVNIFEVFKISRTGLPSRAKTFVRILCLLGFGAVFRFLHCCSANMKSDPHARLRHRPTTSYAQVLTFAKIGTLGRLGNQLFQVAATVGIAERHKLRWQFPTTVSTTPIGRLFNLTGGFDLLTTQVTQCVEASQIFHEISLPREVRTRTLSLHGYYQSPLYFEHSHTVLSKFLRIDKSLSRHVSEKVPQVLRPNSVTVHVRRGDYSRPPFNELYRLMDLEYFLKALDALGDVDLLILLTDDKVWCKENLELHLPYKVVYSPFSDEVFDFVLLHLGRRLIIANSSFSWWAAYLKLLYGDIHATVIAPRRWYNASGKLAYLDDRTFFFPPNWHLIDT